jgi:hypothetical protein
LAVRRRAHERADRLWTGTLAARGEPDHAADCLKRAKSASNDADQALLLQMAETWRHLAERAEIKAAVRDNQS